MVELKPQRVILEKDLPAFTALKRTQIADLIARDKFPKPIKLSERRKAWLEAEVAAWQIEQIRNRDGGGK